MPGRRVPRMNCRVSQIFGPFILSFQLWFLLKFTKTGATLWGKSSQRLELAQRCLDCLRRGQAGQSRTGRWAFLEPRLPEVGDLGKRSSQIQSLTLLQPEASAMYLSVQLLSSTVQPGCSANHADEGTKNRLLSSPSCLGDQSLDCLRVLSELTTVTSG